MIIKNVTQSELELALKKLNELYNDPCFERDWELREIIRNEGNIIWNRFEQRGNRFHVTLKCRSRWASGHRIHQKPFGNVKEGFTRSKSACWHVHGDAFDIIIAINENAVIKSAKRTIDKNGGNWQDWNIGSMIYPMVFSQACEC